MSNMGEVWLCAAFGCVLLLGEEEAALAGRKLDVDLISIIVPFLCWGILYRYFLHISAFYR